MLAWGGVGRVRVSIRPFNDEPDIDDFIDFLSRAKESMVKGSE
jgi:selenocysteine lyase/cysteine desulfurase